MGKLVPGKTYFNVVFADEHLRVPLVRTLIYDREGMRANGIETYLFRELPSFEKESRFYVDKKDVDHLIDDENSLLDKLRRCFDGTLASGQR